MKTAANYFMPWVRWTVFLVACVAAALVLGC